MKTWHDCGARAIEETDPGQWFGWWFQMSSGTSLRCSVDCGSGSRLYWVGRSFDDPARLECYAIPLVWQ